MSQPFSYKEGTILRYFTVLGTIGIASLCLSFPELIGILIVRYSGGVLSVNL